MGFPFDLEDALIFPPEIAATLQRPDIVIFSCALRQVILIELTVPLEDRVCATHERKRNRYLPLLSLCQSNGWNATHFPVEVGSRGIVAWLKGLFSDFRLSVIFRFFPRMPT